MPLDAKNFGEQVRTIRKQQGLTLKELAEKTQRSVSLLSQIENGNISPSFNTMQTIAEELEIHFSQIISSEQNDEVSDSYIMEASERKVLLTAGGIQHQLLSRGLLTPFEFLFVEMPPGTSTGEVQFAHDGMECALLLEGELLLEINGQSHHLKPGDSMTFNSTIPHKASNPGQTKAVAIWVNSAPYIFSTK